MPIYLNGVALKIIKKVTGRIIPKQNPVPTCCNYEAFDRGITWI